MTGKSCKCVNKIYVNIVDDCEENSRFSPKQQLKTNSFSKKMLEIKLLAKKHENKWITTESQKHNLYK